METALLDRPNYVSATGTDGPAVTPGGNLEVDLEVSGIARCVAEEDDFRKPSLDRDLRRDCATLDQGGCEHR